MCALFDDLTRAHDDHAVAEEAHDIEVVADEEIAHANALLEIMQQVEHDRLDGDIERGGRLVENDEVGIERDGAGNADARLLAAGQLMRQAV